MYENRYGRFTAVDPLLASGKSANPQTFNRYVYVGNNPILRTDPLGLDWYRKYNEEKRLWEFNEAGGDGWERIEFGKNAYLTIPGWCWNGDCGFGDQLGYIYQSGGWDLGKRADSGIRDALADTGIGYAQFGWNSFAGASNAFYWGAERSTLQFITTGRPLDIIHRTPYWEAENQTQANAQLAMTGLALYYGAATSATRGSPAFINGISTARTSTGVGSAIQFEQYALRAASDGLYPVMQRGSAAPVGSIFLKQGDVWKFGQTTKGAARYPASWLDDMGLLFRPEFKTPSYKEVLQIERQRIVEYEARFGKLPPGNKIRR